MEFKIIIKKLNESLSDKEKTIFNQRGTMKLNVIEIIL